MAFQVKEFDTIKSDFISSLKSKIIQNGWPANVTDYNVGAVLDMVVEAFSDVMEGTYYDMFQITRESLENIYNGFNFFRIPGRRAVCVVTVYIDTFPTNLSDSTFFNIPRGTILATNDGNVEFEVVDDFSSLKIHGSDGPEFIDKASYHLNAMCTKNGAAGNITDNKLAKFITEITNVHGYPVYIRNDAASGGFDEETEENMKKRFQKYIVSLRRGTTEAIAYGMLSNANYTGLLFSINKYEPMYVLRQGIDIANTTQFEDYEDLTYYNKFNPSYYLVNSEDFAGEYDEGYPDDHPICLYFGFEERFFSLLIPTLSMDLYKISDVEYWDGVSKEWVRVEQLNIDLDPPSEFLYDQYLTWFLDQTRWMKFQIKDYEAYFIRMKVTKTVAGEDYKPIEIIKAMTYPFPGYVDIYSLKNYRNTINNQDKILISEAIENYKAAGVITTVISASVIQMYPVIIIFASPSFISQIPTTLSEDIKEAALEYANGINIGNNFDRNSFYSYIYERFSQYGAIFIYYNYDNSIVETNTVFKEGSKEVVFDMSLSQKADLNFADVYVISNLNQLASPWGMTGVFYEDFDTNFTNNFWNTAY